MVNNVWFGGIFKCSIFWMKSVVSLTKLGSFSTKGLRIESTKAEISSVGQPTAEMMGLPGLLRLCILGRRYSWGRRGNL